jgi:hypothetical protein
LASSFGLRASKSEHWTGLVARSSWLEDPRLEARGSELAIF